MDLLQKLWFLGCKKKKWNARPHLGKYWQHLKTDTFNIYDYIATVFPFEKFDQIRRKIDPIDLFLNKSIAKLMDADKTLINHIDQLEKYLEHTKIMLQNWQETEKKKITRRKYQR